MLRCPLTSRLTPRCVLTGIGLACVLLLAFGLYLQHAVGLEPCPMCIVQRYAFILIAIVAFIAACFKRSGWQRLGAGVIFILAGLGAFVAGRQSWLQWYPPEFAACGRDLYGMIETFPLQRIIPLVFAGSGDCTKVDWSFLGGSIANWSFICFCAIALTALALTFCAGRCKSTAY